MLARPLDAGAARPSRCRSSAWRAGYLSGSGWKDYQATGAVCGIALPPGLRESDRLPAADLHAGHEGARAATTSTSARPRPAALVGADLVAALRDLTLRALRRRRRARRIAAASSSPTRSSSSACTATTGRALILIDEVLTPDSSRFWPQDQYAPGRPAAELRQAVRPRLPRADPAGTSSRRCPRCPTTWCCDAREVPRSVPPPHRPARLARDGACSEQLERLVDEMVDQGRPLRRRAARVREALHRAACCARRDGNLGKAADLLGHPPQHAQPQDGRVPAPPITPERPSTPAALDTPRCGRYNWQLPQLTC